MKRILPVVLALLLIFAIAAPAAALSDAAPALTAGTAVRIASRMAKISFHSNVAGTYFYQLDGTPPVPAAFAANPLSARHTDLAVGANSFNFGNLSAEEHKMYIVAEDAAGNLSGLLAITIPAYTAPAPPAAQSTRLNKAAVVLKTGRSVTLAATVSPSAANQAVKWTTSSRSVARLSVKNGKAVVTGVKKGRAVITATTVSGGRKARCTVYVDGVKNQKIKLSSTRLALNSGDTRKLGVAYTPQKPSHKKLVWTSSNPAVAKVSSAGKVTAVSKGTATIAAATEEGGKKARCVVTVRR